MKFAIWMFSFLIGACGSLGAQDIPQKIMALENLWSQATTSRDVKAVDALLDDAFFYVEFDGREQNKTEILAELQKSGIQQAVTLAMTVKVHASSAIVTGIFEFKGMRNGKPFQHRCRFVDTWVFRNGRWVCAASQVTPLQE